MIERQKEGRTDGHTDNRQKNNRQTTGRQTTDRQITDKQTDNRQTEIWIHIYAHTHQTKPTETHTGMHLTQDQ